MLLAPPHPCEAALASPQRPTAYSTFLGDSRANLVSVDSRGGVIEWRLLKRVGSGAGSERKTLAYLRRVSGQWAVSRPQLWGVAAGLKRRSFLFLPSVMSPSRSLIPLFLLPSLFAPSPSPLSLNLPLSLLPSLSPSFIPPPHHLSALSLFLLLSLGIHSKFAAALRHMWRHNLRGGRSGLVLAYRPPRVPRCLPTAGPRAMLKPRATGALLNDLWAFRPAAGSWTEVATTGSTPSARSGAGFAATPDGSLWVFGGQSSGGGCIRFACVHLWPCAFSSLCKEEGEGGRN